MKKLALTAIVLSFFAAGMYSGKSIGEYKQSHADSALTRQTAIQYGCGHYNEKTGEYEWIKTNTEVMPLSQFEDLPLPKPKNLPTNHKIPAIKSSMLKENAK